MTNNILRAYIDVFTLTSLALKKNKKKTDPMPGWSKRGCGATRGLVQSLGSRPCLKGVDVGAMPQMFRVWALGVSVRPCLEGVDVGAPQLAVLRVN